MIQHYQLTAERTTRGGSEPSQTAGNSGHNCQKIRCYIQKKIQHQVITELKNAEAPRSGVVCEWIDMEICTLKGFMDFYRRMHAINYSVYSFHINTFNTM